MPHDAPFWDEELLELTTRALDLFGEDMVGEALDCAMASMIARGFPRRLSQAALLHAMSLKGDGADAELMHAAVVRDALKSELRRRLRPQ